MMGYGSQFGNPEMKRQGYRSTTESRNNCGSECVFRRCNER